MLKNFLYFYPIFVLTKECLFCKIGLLTNIYFCAVGLAYAFSFNRKASYKKVQIFNIQFLFHCEILFNFCRLRKFRTIRSIRRF